MSGDRYQDNLGYYCRDAGLKYPDKPAIIEVLVERGSETSPWKYIHR